MGWFVLWAIVSVALICVALIYCVVMLVRNVWVYRQQTRISDRCYAERIARLMAGDLSVAKEDWWSETDYLSYDEMMHLFWIWDVQKLRKPGAPHHEL